MTTSWSRTQAERYRQLAELWPRATQLNGREIERLCILVLEILSQCSKVNLASTGQEVEDLIHAYIEERVLLRLATDPAKFAAQMPTSHGALILFFQNFVISMARKSESQLARQAHTLETEEGVIRPEVESHYCQIDLVDRLQEEGFSINQLEQEVRTFLAGMSSIERTLVHNYCDADLSVARLFPNSSQQQSLARVAVAQMGLWYGRTGNRDLAKFTQTRLGRFMAQQIGQPLNETHSDTLQVLMSLICQLA
jgi:hypothetical protein